MQEDAITNIEQISAAQQRTSFNNTARLSPLWHSPVFTNNNSPDTAANGGMKMNYWKTTIFQLNPTLLVESVDGEIFDYENVISTLENYMQTDCCHKIKNAFNYNPDGLDKFSATFHCEGVLGRDCHRYGKTHGSEVMGFVCMGMVLNFGTP